MEVGLDQGEAKYFKKSSEGIMHSSNLYDDMQVFLQRRDSRTTLITIAFSRKTIMLVYLSSVYLQCIRKFWFKN